MGNPPESSRGSHGGIGDHFPPGISFVAYQPCPFAAGRGVPFPKFASHQEGRGRRGSRAGRRGVALAGTAAKRGLKEFQRRAHRCTVPSTGRGHFGNGDTCNPNIYGNTLECSLANYTHAVIPADGDRITNEGGELVVPDRPIIPFIEGDGIGPDIWRATQAVIDASVEHAYQGARQMVLDGDLRRRKSQGKKQASGSRRRPSRRSGSSKWVSRGRSPRRSAGGFAL